MGNEDIHVIENDPLIIVDKFPYVKKGKITNGLKDITKDEADKKIKKIYFLTHFHSDHYGNINKNFKEHVFTSTTTKKLLTNIIGVEEKYIHNLQINKIYYLFNFQVLFIDANHCPGAVIIYMEFCNGIKILHTGDFRCTNVQIFILKKILSLKNPKTKKEKLKQIEDYEELEKIRIIEEKNLGCDKIYLNEKNEKGSNEKGSSEKGSNENNSREIKESDKYINQNINTNINKEYIILNNKKFDICQVTEKFNIYKSCNFILSVEEFRTVYLHNIENLLSDLKNKSDEFYVYDDIELNNVFHYFIFIELSLYFNQNEQEVTLLFKNGLLNKDDVILKAETVKDVRFLLKFFKKDKSKTYCNILPNTEWEQNWKEKEENEKKEKEVNEKKEKENEKKEKEKNEKKEEIEKKKKEMNEKKEEKNNNFSPTKKKRLRSINYNESNKNKENGSKQKNVKIKRRVTNDESQNSKENDENLDTIPLKKKRVIKEKTDFNFSDEEDMSNCIKTVYLDTTYILSKNNMFAPQIYLINFVVYLCKQRIENDLNLEYVFQETESNSKEIKVKREIEIKGEKKGMEEGICKEVETFKDDISKKTMKKKRKTLFLFGTYNIGKEKIYLTLAEACNLKIHFRNPKKKKIIKTFLNDPYILNKITDNKLEAQIHIVDINYSYIFPKVEKRKFRNLLDEEIENEFTSFFYIIPTGWTKKYFFYEKENITIILLPYSEHSNKNEIINFVKSIKPCEIIPTVFDDEKKKIKILQILNPYLNLKMATYNMFNINNCVKSKKNMIYKQAIKKDREKAMKRKKKNEIKKYRTYKTKADKIVCDKNQTTLSSFVTFISRSPIKTAIVD